LNADWFLKLVRRVVRVEEVFLLVWLVDKTLCLFSNGRKFDSVSFIKVGIVNKIIIVRGLLQAVVYDV
jgi:hypothetical protein